MLAIASLVVLAACGGTPARRDAELAELARLLPGDYDNREQASSPDGADLPALRVAIVPIYAPLVGRNIFYLQEMAADDSRRVTAQRVLSLEVTPKGRLLEGLYSLNEPQRWRDGHEKLDLFKSLLPQDLKLASGCEILWTPKGAGFTGANDPARCRIPRPGGGATVNQESRVELDAAGIAFSDVQIDAAGARSPSVPRWYRFRRQAH
jgi:hypothetical protein